MRIVLDAAYAAAWRVELLTPWTPGGAAVLAVEGVELRGAAEPGQIYAGPALRPAEPVQQHRPEGVELVEIPAAVEAWVGWLRLRELSEAQVTNSRRLTMKAAADEGWRTLGDITRETVEAHLAHLQERGLVPKTRNEIRNALSRLCAYAVGRGWMPDNPVGATPRAKVIKRRARLVPSEDDVRRLIAAARKDWRKRDRWLVYLTAATTGLRWSTLRALERDMLHLDADPPFLDIPARLLKNREPGIVWLTAELAEALSENLSKAYVFEPNAGDAPASRLFRSVPKHSSFDRDLRAAGLAKGGGDQGTFSFHSLRHFASNRMAWVGGFTTGERQRANGHKTEAMTEHVYTDPAHVALGRKVHEMPPMLATSNGADG